MTPDVFDISGKIILVTGAGRGIGKGVAQVLAEAGADVAINALTETHVVPLAEDLAEATGRTVIPVIADVTTPDGARKAVDDVLTRLGRLDVLVNGLGDSIRTPLVGLPGSEAAGSVVSDEKLKFVVDINPVANGLSHEPRIECRPARRAG